MSDKDEEGGGKGCRNCCLLLLIALVAFGAYTYFSFSSMRQDEPLAFPAVKSSKLDEGLLTAKFKANELPSRLLGGDTVVRLDQEELNTLLFAKAGHTDGGEKARIVLESNSMWIEAVKPLEEGGYLNIRAHVALVLAKGAPPQIRVLGGSIGGFELGPLTTPMVQSLAQRALQEAAQREPKLGNAVGFEVKNGQVELTYPPEGLKGQ